MSFNINSSSQPVYDRAGFDNYWSATDWIKWHKAMKKDFGHQRANEIFIDAYHNPPSEGFWSILGPLEMFHHMNYRTIDQQFIKYAKENQFHEALFSGFLGTVVGKTASVAMQGTDKALTTGSDVINDAFDVVGNASDSLLNLSKWLQYLLPILVLVALFLAYKFYSKNAATALKALKHV